ncbi:MAG: hypothetical protein HY460_00910 [Parcubacteria group bacterium]|nr:hypothetical protein [Parcubacteria group bacterium]
MRWRGTEELLARFKRTHPASRRKSAVLVALKPYGISEEHVTVFGSVVRLRGIHPALRSEIALNKSEILDRIQKETGNWCTGIT